MAQREKHETPEKAALVEATLSCVDRRTLRLLDLASPLRRMEEHDPAEYLEMYASAHMNRAGNAWVADRLADLITDTSRPLLSSRN